MQSALVRRFVQNYVKFGSRVLQSNLKHAVGAQSLATKAPSVISLTSGFHRYFADQVQFDKVTSYESLISRISNANGVEDLLDIMNQNLALFKNEHVVLTLRVLARLVRSSNQNQGDLLQKDERYLALTKKAQENLENFNEYEILDFLFWLRRFKTNKLPIHLSDESLNKLYSKVAEFVQSKSFNFRNLVNLYYDLTCLGRNTDEIAGEILNELKTDGKLLTPFTVVQIIQAAATKKSSLSPREVSVVDFVQRNINDMLAEFDSDQKCMVFKFLAGLEMHTHPPRFRVPNILITLKSNLKEVLDQLSEMGVNNIIEAYADLPREFPSDLLDEIKEMVIVTIQHNSENIKSFFLIDFLDKTLNLSRFRKLQNEKVLIVYEEIAKRIPEDDYMSKPKTIERILDIYERADVEYEAIIDRIYQRALNLKSIATNWNILHALHRNKKDITPIIDKFIADGGQKKLGYFQQVNFYLLLSGIETDKYKSVMDELRATFDASTDTWKIIANISEVARNPELDTLMEGAIKNLQSNKGKLPVLTFYKNMFLSAQNRKSRDLWSDWIKENLANAEKNELTRVVDAAFTVSRPTGEQTFLVLRIMELAKPENFPLKRLISYLRDNKDFITQLTRTEGRIERFLNRIIQIQQVGAEEIRLPLVYGFLKRLELLNVRSSLVARFAANAYEISKNRNEFISGQLDLLFSIYLMENQRLKPEDAKEIYEKNKKFESSTINARLLTYILQRSTENPLENQDIVNDVNLKLENLNKQLSETGGKTVLTALANILAFPPQFLEPNKDLYIKSLKGFIGYGNTYLYMNLINAIPPQYVRKNLHFYLPFIRELIINYPKINQRLTPAEIVKVLKKFSSLNTRNPTIYNYILADIGRTFNSFKPEDLTEIVEAFANVSILQSDLFDKIIAKVTNHPQNLGHLGRALFSGFYKVGFKTPQAKTSFLEVFPKITSRKSSNILALACYIPILNLENEAELLEKLVPVFPEQTGLFSQRQLYLLHEYLRTQYKAKPELAESVKKLIRRFDEIHQGFAKESNAMARSKQIICEYLNVMKVNYQTDFSLDGFRIDVYVPEQKKLVKIFLGGDVNFDKIHLGGRASTTKRIYEGFEGYTTSFINMAEFTSTPEHINRINYLKASGIQDNNKEDQANKTNEEELVEEGEKEEEVGVGVEENAEELINEEEDKPAK